MQLTHRNTPQHTSKGIPCNKVHNLTRADLVLYIHPTLVVLISQTSSSSTCFMWDSTPSLCKRSMVHSHRLTGRDICTKARTCLPWVAECLTAVIHQVLRQFIHTDLVGHTSSPACQAS